MQRLEALTSLRFFAAASIVALHLRLGGGNFGLGVPFFFVLSGFILTYVYRNFEETTVRQFYLTRFARLYPVHLLTFLAAALFVHRYMLYRPEGWAIAVSNLALLHTWIPLHGVPFLFNGVSWSIGAEASFYAVFPLMARSKHFARWYSGILVLTVAYLLLLQALHIAPSAKLYTIDLGHCLLQIPVVRILEFATGVAFGRYFVSATATPGFISTYPNLAEGLVLAGLVIFLTTAPALQRWLNLAGLPVFGRWYVYSGSLIAFAPIVFVFAYARGFIGGLLKNRWLVLLGEISFATYMLHFIIICVIKIHVPNMPNWAFVLSVIAVTYPASYVVWRFVEVPSKRAILAFATRRARPDHRTIGDNSEVVISNTDRRPSPAPVLANTPYA